MATSQTDLESQTIELSTEAFETFCEDISGMFGIDMNCSQHEPCTETVKELRKGFKKIAAVNLIKSEGDISGTFQMIFDKAGLFTLAGIIVMLPEQRILENCKRGTTKEAEEMSDAIGEAGNLLVGSWDRIFREGSEGHGHFVQTDTFIGDPWTNSQEKIGLADDEELLFIPYEMTIDPYPTFNCGVIFPKTLFDKTSASDIETDDPVEEKTEEEAPTEDNNIETETEAKAEPEAEPEAKAEAEPDESTEPAETPESAEPTETPEETEAPTSAVSDTIQRIVQSPADLPGEHLPVSLAKHAQDIMQKEVVWASTEDNVQQALTKMQQADAGYMMVGTDGTLEGIVAKSDITGAISVYLKPMFAKWRRPIDDATLQIKIKWIMTRPIRTIKPDTPITAIMEAMRQFGIRCLPVVDQQGKVAGLVTVFDVFKALLDTKSGLSTEGKTPQAPSQV